MVVPEGVFLTGAIHLKSSVNLHVSEERDAAVQPRSEALSPRGVHAVRRHGVHELFAVHLRFRADQRRPLRAKGTLDGAADCDHLVALERQRRIAAGKTASPKQTAATAGAGCRPADKDVPVTDRVYGEGSYLRPQFIQPYRCTNVLIEGVTIRNSPMWEINPVLCTQRDGAQRENLQPWAE